MDNSIEIDGSFLENFLAVTNQVQKEGASMSWEIPADADKTRGDYGLLSEDNEIDVWAVPQTTAEFLRFLVALTEAKNILELGTSIGYSTLYLALGAKETTGHVFTTESFKPKAALAKNNFEKARLDDHITVFENDNETVLKNWQRGKIDFVFMDADKQQYRKYLELLIPLLADKGVIVADNAGNYPQYMKDFLEECTKLDYQSLFLNIDNGLLLISKASRINFYS